MESGNVDDRRFKIVDPVMLIPSAHDQHYSDGLKQRKQDVFGGHRAHDDYSRKTSVQ